MEFNRVGALILLAVGIIVAISFLTGSIFPTIGSITQKVDVPITTQVVFPTNTTALTLSGQSVESVVVINDTTTIAGGNYTITNNVLSNGALIATLIGNGPNVYNGTTVNISYTYEPFGYQSNGGNRAVVGLIAIFASLAIAVFALSKVLEDGILDSFS